MPAEWKAITLDYENLSTYDDADQIGICLTQRQVAILKALLTTAYWTTRWTNLGITKDALESQMADIDSQLDGNDCPGCNMEFRDNPADMCEVQYSNDGGETWTTMFRKDVCVAPSLISFTEIEINKTTIDNDWTTYAGDITNVAPGWEYEGEDTDAALCMAIRIFVDWVCDVAAAEMEANNEVIKDIMKYWNDTKEELTFLLIPVAISYGIPGITLGALAWVCTNVMTEYLAVLVDKEREYYLDEAAREDVRCWMYNSMRGDTISYDAWESSLDTYVGTSVAADAIQASVKTWLASEKLFVEYLILVNDLTELPGELPDCDCPTDLIIDALVGDDWDDFFGARFCHMTLLAYSNPGDAQAVCPAYYNFEQDIYTGIASSIGGQGANMYVQLPPNKLVTKVQVEMGVFKVLEATNGDKNAGLWLGTPNDGGTYIGGYSWAATTGVWQDHTITVEDALGILSTPEDRLYIHNSVNTDNSLCRINWIHIEMIDYEP